MKNLIIVILFVAAAFGIICFQLKNQTVQTQTSSTNVENQLQKTKSNTALAKTEHMPTEVTLTKRIDNGEYAASAYSFRLASQDLAVHHNNVDLVFDRTGQIYINPTGGMNSRITDLGTGPFDSSIATLSTNADWQQYSFTPQTGHVYYQEVKDERQNFAVEFLVTEVTPDIVKLRWKPADTNHKVLPLESGAGSAGTMGIGGL